MSGVSNLVVSLTSLSLDRKPVQHFPSCLDLQIAAARKSALPTAPRSARGTDDERIPNSPPYVAYITNIPFETIEEDIEEFFRDLQVRLFLI